MGSYPHPNHESQPSSRSYLIGNPQYQCGTPCNSCPVFGERTRQQTTHRYMYIHVNTCMYANTQTQAHIQSQAYAHIQTSKQASKQTNKQASKQTSKQTSKPANKQTDRQTTNQISTWEKHHNVPAPLILGVHHLMISVLENHRVIPTIRIAALSL